MALHVLMQIRRHGPIHGYALIREMGATTGRPEGFKEGTLYPLLSQLERQGVIRSEWVSSTFGPARKAYTITPLGRQALRQGLRTLDRIWSTFLNLNREAGGPNP